MARGMNHVFFIGTLSRDAEFRVTEGANPFSIIEATVAGEDHAISHDGRALQLPWYHRISIVGKQAEWLANQNLVAGTPVLVEGTLEYRSWDDPNGGGKRSMVRVKASRLDKLGTMPETVTDAGGGIRMKGGMNEVLVVGNLTRDAEMRQTSGGAVVSLGLAVNESWFDRASNDWKEKTHWIDVTLWRELAEQAQSLKKGDPILVRGRLVNDSWQDKEGNKRNTTKVEATRVEVLARGASTQNGEYAATPAAPRQTTSSAASSAGHGYANPSKGNQSSGLDIDDGLDEASFPEENMPF